MPQRKEIRISASILEDYLLSQIDSHFNMHTDEIVTMRIERKHPDDKSGMLVLEVKRSDATR